MIRTLHLSMREAIERFIADGASVALEGFTHLIPFAAGHEIIRQGRRNLHLIRMTPDLIYDQMIQRWHMLDRCGCHSDLRQIFL